MKKSDVFVYIAGKYTATDLLSVELNVSKAQELAITCAKEDILYFCPHTHSRLMDFYVPEVTWEYWMRCDMKVISTLCNCMLMISNYKDSKGALLEEKKAKELGYPIFYNIDDFLTWYSNLEN